MKIPTPDDLVEQAYFGSCRVYHGEAGMVGHFSSSPSKPGIRERQEVARTNGPLRTYAW